MLTPGSKLVSSTCGVPALRMGNVLQEEVVSLSTQLQQLRDQFGQKTTEQLDLKAKADLMERRLTAASKLIAGLSSERTRWTADMQASAPHLHLAEQSKVLVMCCKVMT